MVQRRSGAGAMVSNDEREQTLNQLMADMDGFDPASGIVVFAATNRSEVLDAALLRQGRFDRQVTIPLPTLPERVAILQVHSRDKCFDSTVDLEVVARATPGFSGADLANLVNEAAIVAVRDNWVSITGEDLQVARVYSLASRPEPEGTGPSVTVGPNRRAASPESQVAAATPTSSEPGSGE